MRPFGFNSRSLLPSNSTLSSLLQFSFLGTSRPTVTALRQQQLLRRHQTTSSSHNNNDNSTGHRDFGTPVAFLGGLITSTAIVADHHLSDDSEKVRYTHEGYNPALTGK